MRTRSGPLTLLAAGTPATSATALEPIELSGNKVKLFVTTVTGGAGTLTITAKTSFDGSVYHDVIDRNSAWSTSTSVIDTAGTYDLDLTGLPLDDGGFLKLYYACTTGAGTIAIKAVNYVDPGGSSSVETGDIIADLSTTNTLLTAGNVDLAALEVLSTAANVDLAAMEVLQTSIDGKVPALGSAAMAASSPATIATDDTVMAAINALITAGNVDLAALEVLSTAANVDLAAMEVLLGTIDADTGTLTSAYTGATTSHRKEEVDPLSAQYMDSDGGTSLGSTTTVAAAGTTYYPSSAGQALDGYTTSLVGLYCTGGIETGPTNCTNTLTLEATIGLEVAAADRWFDIGASVLDCTTGASWAGSIVSTGTTAAECLLDLGHNAPMKIRIKSVVAGGDPDSTNASVIAALTASAL